MRPAQAMGTFLKVWRSEWAGLSRAQLAIAVSAWMTNGKRVRPGVIQWWEEGQPPSSTEELEALLQVMRTHGLSPSEVHQFRTTVFASCLARQYPTLFPGDIDADRDDLQEAIEATSAHTVGLVAWTAELWNAVAGESRPRRGPAQARRQQVALASVQEALALAHMREGRPTLAAQQYASNAESLELYFGRRGPGDHSVLGARSNQFLASGTHWTRVVIPEAVGELVPVPAAAAAARAQLNVMAEARARGEESVAQHALYAALNDAWALPRERVPSLIREGEQRLLQPESGLDPTELMGGRSEALARACLFAGLRRAAEPHIANVAVMAADYPHAWHLGGGWLAVMAGRYDEARDHFQRGMSVPDLAHAMLLGVRRGLAVCDRAPNAARPRRATAAKRKPLKRTKPAAK